MSTSSSSDSSREEDSPQRRRIMDGNPTGIVAPRRSTQQTQLPARYRDYALMSNIMNVVEPVDYEQAKEHEQWRNDMNYEYDSLMKNKTWELVELPEKKSSN